MVTQTCNVPPGWSTDQSWFRKCANPTSTTWSSRYVDVPAIPLPSQRLKPTFHGCCSKLSRVVAVDVWSDLYKHIVLSGGSSMYSGLPSRFGKEIKQHHLTHLLNGDPSRLNVSHLIVPSWIRYSRSLPDRDSRSRSKIHRVGNTWCFLEV